jgi:AMP phosphorylase
MKLKVKPSDISVLEPVVMMNGDDCLELGVGINDRVIITGNSVAVCAVTISDTLMPKGTIGIPSSVLEKCGVSGGDSVEVEYSHMPESVRSIRKKINGYTLSKEEIDSIVRDIMDGNLSDKEIIGFVSAFNVNNSDLSEVAYLTRSMAATGTVVDLGVRPVFDFHSLGGVPGNKITPIVVSIAASEGLVIPKLSSRAVSSACGTSDFVDTFCDVEMDTDSLLDAIKRTGGVFACGNEDYAPVGRKIIRAERPMGIDPRPTMMASIMSKKVAVGTTHLVVDIPMGRGSKIPDLKTAKSFSDDLIDLGTLLGIHVECAVSRADQPLGTAIGPVLEARECIRILENGSGDASVIDKACGMAGILLEMAGEKDGKAKAKEILESGKAHRKFMEIVKVQNGRADLKSSDLVPGSFVKDIHAKRDGRVLYVDNSNMVAIAKGAGAPNDIGAGIEIVSKKGDTVSKGDVLFRIYAENQAKLDRAVESARSRRPMEVQDRPVDPVPDDMIMERIPTKEMLDLIRFHSR